MASKVAIIGLGQIGASIGLALKEKSGLPEVLGSDKDSAVAGAAEALGAVGKIARPTDAVKDADVVVLCLPLSEMRAVLKRIGPFLKEGAVLMDTAPIKSPVTGWVAEFLPPKRFYLGLVPTVTAEALGAPETGIKGARADLFRRTVMVISAPPNTPAEVEQLGINFASLLGAKALLADFAESDGLMTSVHLLPQLAAAALLDACVDAPGWPEARKIAGRPFAGVTGGLAYYDDPRSLQAAALANPKRAVHALDVVIASLKGLRDDIDRQDEESVGERLLHSFESRERWLTEREAAEWLKEGGSPVEVPAAGEQVMQMLFGSRIADRNKKAKSTTRAPSAPKKAKDQ
jgi:prephenate dehydrogenase